MDSETTLDQLKNNVWEFCEERDWVQFHNAKDLSIGIITEASELIEYFRFKSESEVDMMIQDENQRIKLGEELADIFYFILLFSKKYDFDLTSELSNKMIINKQKYPVDKFKSSNQKYTDLK